VALRTELQPRGLGRRARRLVQVLGIVRVRVLVRIDSLVEGIGRLVSLSIFLLIGMVIYEVFAPYFFNAPTRWVYDTSGWFQVAYVSWAAPSPCKEGISSASTSSTRACRRSGQGPVSAAAGPGAHVTRLPNALRAILDGNAVKDTRRRDIDVFCGAFACTIITSVSGGGCRWLLPLLLRPLLSHGWCAKPKFSFRPLERGPERTYVAMQHSIVRRNIIEA
jgi:hypothetical protein